jgi:hypothetical protein
MLLAAFETLEFDPELYQLTVSSYMRVYGGVLVP